MSTVNFYQFLILAATSDPKIDFSRAGFKTEALTTTQTHLCGYVCVSHFISLQAYQCTNTLWSVAFKRYWLIFQIQHVAINNRLKWLSIDRTSTNIFSQYNQRRNSTEYRPVPLECNGQIQSIKTDKVLSSCMGTVIKQQVGTRLRSVGQLFVWDSCLVRK